MTSLLFCYIRYYEKPRNNKPKKNKLRLMDLLIYY